MKGSDHAEEDLRPDQIIAKLRHAEVLPIQGMQVPEVVKTLGFREVTYHRWRKEYGGRSIVQVRRLKELERENAHLCRTVSDLTLNKLFLPGGRHGETSEPLGSTSLRRGRTIGAQRQGTVMPVPDGRRKPVATSRTIPGTLHDRQLRRTRMCGQEFGGMVALVTGGASGIGEACVKTFALGGARVVIVDRNEELGEKTVAAVERAGGEARFLRVDVADAPAVERMVADIVATDGRLDIAVNNAGIGDEPNPTGSHSISGWHRVIDVNLNGVFYCMRYEIPQMLEQGSGAIVNMSSILGSVGYPMAPAYVAAKHALVGLTKTAALEYGQQGLRINSVGPGFIKTPLLAGALDEDAQTHISGLHAMGRMGEAQEVADLVAYLCSEKASFLTGGYYLVDGGYTAQ
jgi:NAD(P)-dependent dehydrogenase (short-subunit alcohol dehydrogenase family)